MKNNPNMTRGEIKGSRFSMPDAEFVATVAPALVPTVTAGDIESCDDSAFDTPLDIEVPVPDSSTFRKRLDETTAEAQRAKPIIRVLEEQTLLFPDSDMQRLMSGAGYDFSVSRQRFASLIPLVIQAFSDIRQGWSADYVLLNPEFDVQFIQRCWRLGAVAAPEELNWTLMNARKDGKLKGLTAERSFSLSKKELDGFCFAAEMAMRELQDRAWYEEHREGLSLDKLLCSPRLCAEFDSLANRVAPGFTSLQYRWAAMTLRKARRLVQNPQPLPLFEDFGPLKDVRPSTMTTDAGVYWVTSEDRSSYVGVAANLRIQTDAFIGQLGGSACPEWMQDKPQGHARLQILPMSKAQSDDRERLRSSLFRRAGSRLNFKDRSFFGGTAGAA